MSAITTHVLDTSRGRPAAGVPVLLETYTDDGGWQTLGSGATDADGRLRHLLPEDHDVGVGTYRLTFGAEAYFVSQGVEGFYPTVVVTFYVADAAQHYHVPLLLSPYGYSTYRGS